MAEYVLTIGVRAYANALFRSGAEAIGRELAPELAEALAPLYMGESFLAGVELATGEPMGQPCPVALAHAAAEIDARKEAAELRAALAELAADICHYEPGNPWRLDSLKAASRLLTGEPMGFDSWPVLRARAERGTTGGRFRNPWTDMQRDGLA